MTKILLATKVVKQLCNRVQHFCPLINIIRSTEVKIQELTIPVNVKNEFGKTQQRNVNMFPIKILEIRL